MLMRYNLTVPEALFLVLDTSSEEAHSKDEYWEVLLNRIDKMKLENLHRLLRIEPTTFTRLSAAVMWKL